MPDEIDLLRQFRADTPGPGPVAWQRARAAVAAAQPEAGKAAGRRWLARGRVQIAAVAAVVLVAAAVAVTLALQPPTLSGPKTTAWQPARPLPQHGHAVPAPAGTWRLASYLVARGWQQNTAGPRPGLLTCPTASVCYVEGDSATSPSGPADMNSLYLSADGTRTWDVLPVPAHVTFTSPLACVTASQCAAGGQYGSQPVYLTTTTGAHSWTVRPLPAGIGPISELSCTPARCQGLADPPGTDPQDAPPTLGGTPDTTLVATRDGGRSWSADAFPARDAISSVSCPTAAECVAAGLTGPRWETGVALVSRDGGASWRRAALDRPQLMMNPDVTCVDAGHCRMLGYVIGPGSSADSQYSVYDYSDDGGLHWTSVTFPAAIPYPRLDALACPAVQTCYAVGGDLIPQRIGTAINEQSAVVAVTRDAGRTWQRVSFAIPSKVPGGMQADSFMDIGQIACPAVTACVALGVSDQGSASTPVYTTGG
jgi:photosystem II stability/assembly factor-like uncharacterized protein